MISALISDIWFFFVSGSVWNVKSSSNFIVFSAAQLGLMQWLALYRVEDYLDLFYRIPLWHLHLSLHQVNRQVRNVQMFLRFLRTNTARREHILGYLSYESAKSVSSCLCFWKEHCVLQLAVYSTNLSKWAVCKT